MNAKLSPTGRRILCGIVLSYTLAYFNRLNLSAALSGIITDLHITPSAAGLMQTCFAVVYACGQMVSGLIADRAHPRRMALTGLSGSVVCNILLGAIGRYEALLALCALNGAFQSMMWTPLVCLISANYREGKEQLRAHFWLSLTLAVGHFGAWGLTGLACQWIGWRWGFILPALITLPLLPVIFILMKPAKARYGTERADGKTAGLPLGDALRIMIRTGFPCLAVSSIFYGFIKDGVVTWTPTMLYAAGNGNSALAAAFSLVVPVLNLAGILAGYWLRSRSRQGTRHVAARLMPFIGLTCVPLLFTRPLALSALCLGLACAGAYGINPLFSSLMPMEYDRAGCVGLAAGLIDSLIYVGAALSGFVGGTLYESFAAPGLYITWIALSIMSAAFMLAAAKAPKAQ